MNIEPGPAAQAFLQLNEDKRTKCIVYTRVMGYHRPVESFNIGKKGEHKERLFFSSKSNVKTNL